MSSVQCSKCKQGVYYYAEPNGIEFRYINLDDWAKICNSKFDKTNIESVYKKFEL